MRKFFWGAVVTILSVTSAFSQVPSWRVINNSLVSGYTEVVFATDTIGYLAGAVQGNSHSMLRSADTGSDFSNINFPGFVSTFATNMSWPTPQNGYVSVDTGTAPNNSVFVLSTSNGGSSWTVYSINNTLQLQNIYFPSVFIGYATGSLSNGEGYFIAKTTNGGQTWASIYKSDNYVNYSHLYFPSATSGMLLALNSATNVVNVAYTTDGGTSFKFSSLRTDSAANFLHWNDDGSWLAGADSVYRSTDSGRTWKSVVSYDTSAGPASVATFNGKMGFAFRQNEPIVLATTDYGATWASTRLPTAGSPNDTLTPVAASMPSGRVAYLLASDAFATSDVLLKIPIPQSNGGGGNGVVQNQEGEKISFAASVQSPWIILSADPEAMNRSIQVVDVLGRPCGSVDLMAGTSEARMLLSNLHSGDYFARLGNAVVKFTVWE